MITIWKKSRIIAAWTIYRRGHFFHVSLLFEGERDQIYARIQFSDRFGRKSPSACGCKTLDLPITVLHHWPLSENRIFRDQSNCPEKVEQEVGVLCRDDNFLITSSRQYFDFSIGEWISSIFIDRRERVVIDYAARKQTRPEVSIRNGQSISILRVDLFVELSQLFFLDGSSLKIVTSEANHQRQNYGNDDPCDSFDPFVCRNIFGSRLRNYFHISPYF